MVDTIPKTVKFSYMGSSQMCLKNPSKITKNKTVAIHPRDHIKFYKTPLRKIVMEGNNINQVRNHNFDLDVELGHQEREAIERRQAHERETWSQRIQILGMGITAFRALVALIEILVTYW